MNSNCETLNIKLTSEATSTRQATKCLAIGNQQTLISEAQRHRVLRERTHKLILNSETMSNLAENYESGLDKFSKKAIKIETLRKAGLWKKAQRLEDCGRFWDLMECSCCKSTVLVHKSSCHLAYCPYCSKKTYWLIRERLQPIIDKYSYKPHQERGLYSVRELTLTWEEDVESLTQEKQKELKANRLEQVYSLLNPYRKKKRILDGVISFEMKRNPQNHRLHVHVHVMLISAFLPQQELSSKWKAITGNPIVYIQQRKLRNAADYVLKHLRKEPEILPTDVVVYERVLGAGKRRVSTFGKHLYKMSFTCSKETTLCPFCDIPFKTIKFFGTPREVIAYWVERGGG